MSIHRVFTAQDDLDDLETARKLGGGLWEESDLQLDFSDIESVTPEFATELCRTVVERRPPAVLSNALLADTRAPQVQLVFMPAIMAALGVQLRSLRPELRPRAGNVLTP